MDPSAVVFDPNHRERCRNPPAPPGYQITNPPDIIWSERNNGILTIDWDEWERKGMFKEIDPDDYDDFVINSDSEDDDIIEIPVEPVVKNIESICLSDDDDEFIPLDNIKKEKDDKKIKDVEYTEKADKKIKDVEYTEKADKKPPAKDDKEVTGVKEKYTEKKIEVIINREVKETEGRTERTKTKLPETKRKEVDKVIEGVSEKRIDECKEKTSVKAEKHVEKKLKRDNEETRHKKIKENLATVESDKSSRKKNKPRIIDDDNDFEEREERHRRKVKKHRSPSPSDDYVEDYKSSFKQEYDDFKQEYPGTNIQDEYSSRYCHVCNLALNSYSTYQSHITGKRHKKMLDAKNVAQSVARSYVPTKPTSKCPQPPAGFRRIESNSHAKIQEVLDDKLKIPCPGLHMVSEIQSITETSYYCVLCDAPCSVNSILPHLNGFKHQLNCLKHYDSRLYDEISYKNKYQIEGLVSKTLKGIEKKYGRGYLKVEKDVPDDGADYRTSIPSTSFSQERPSTSTLKCIPSTSFSLERPSTSSRSSSSSRDKPSTSEEGADFSQKYKCYSVPDPSKSGFYCRLCDSHSNSKQMWDAHISGKRHIANLKKAPGTAPSKSRYVPAPPGTRARLYSKLDDIYEPIVGLDQIREIHKLDIDSVSYTCFLCAGCIGESEIVDHILSRKHREKYLEKINYPELETLRSCQISDFALDSVIAEMCDKVEDESGRGRPEVYYAKNSLLK